MHRMKLMETKYGTHEVVNSFYNDQDSIDTNTGLLGWQTIRTNKKNRNGKHTMQEQILVQYEPTYLPRYAIPYHNRA